MRIYHPVLTSVLTFAVLVAGLVTYNHAFAAGNSCVVKQQKPEAWSLNPSQKSITGKFEVKGDSGCTQPVSVMSWNADATLLPGAAFWNNQTIYKVTTDTFGVGKHQLTVAVPVCASDPSILRSYQADIIASANPSPNLSPPGTGSFYDGLQADGSGIVVASVVGDNKCPKPNTPPTTTTPPTTPPKTIVYASAPAALPNTGPGTTLGLFALVAVFAGLFHYVRFRPRKAHHHVPQIYFPDAQVHHPLHHAQPHEQQPHQEAEQHHEHNQHHQ